MTPLLVLCDPIGSFNEDGSRGPLWSSDCRPAPTLKGLLAELLQAGWPLHIMLRLPDDDEPVRFYDLYKKEYGQLPKNFAKFQREAAMRHHTANAADPYNLGLPSGATSGKRPDYGTTTKI
jgi:hypothetical protein